MLPSVKVLHMADIHLEWPFGAAGLDDRRARLRREELKEVFAAIIDLTVQKTVQVLLIAGDLFEHAHATRATARFIDQQFRRVPETRVFISPGNHDPLLPDSFYRSHGWAPNVHIFGPEPSRVEVPDLPVTVHGWGFGAYEVRECQIQGLRAGGGDPDRIHLAVFHGGDSPYHPFRPQDLVATGMDYIALGHIHKPGVVAEAGGRVLARYSGSPEALSFGEPGEHGVWVGSVARGESRWEFVPTGRRACIAAQADVTGALTIEDVAGLIRAVDTPEDRARNCYTVTLTGTLDPAVRLDLPVLQERLAPEFYLLRLTDQTRPDVDLPRLVRERSARGLFVQRLLAMEEAAAGDEERRRIRRAMALGLQAFERKGGA